MRHAEDEGKVKFRSEAVLVLVPTLVTDKSGNPIHGLKAGDFQVFENGRKQTLTSVEEVVAKDSQIRMETGPNDLSNVVLNAQDPRAVIVIVLDTINTPYLDQRYGREQLVKYLSTHLRPGQAMALVTLGTNGLQVIHDFTSDPRTLIAALKTFEGRMPLAQGDNMDALAKLANPLPVTGPSTSHIESQISLFVEEADASVASWDTGNALRATLQGFLTLGWALSGIEGRKSVIWVTSSFPLPLDSPSAVPGGRLMGLYERTFHTLNQANVAIYPVDAQGLVESTGIGDVRLSQPTPDVLSSRVWMHTSILENLRVVATMTGGRAFYNRNDLTTGFERAVADSMSYYMLMYYLDKSNRKAGWRRLKVRVDQRGVDVLARGGFFVTNATINAESSRDSDMSIALRSPFDATGIPIAVRLLHEENEGKDREIGFSVRVLPDGIRLEGNDNSFDLDVLTQTSSKSWTTPRTEGKSLRGHIPETQMSKFRSAGVHYESTVDHLKPGTYVVRFIVRDNFSGRVGSVSCPVTVK